MNIISIILIAVGLSMDTFSLALGIGLAKKIVSKTIKCSIVVGIYHIVMPIIGHLVGTIILSYVYINSSILLSIILFIIAISFIINYQKTDNTNYNPSFIGINFFALSVSIDSFSVGIGLVNSNIGYYLIFGLISFVFTLLGFTLAKYLNQRLGNIANILGIIILLFLSIVSFLKR